MYNFTIKFESLLSNSGRYYGEQRTSTDGLLDSMNGPQHANDGPQDSMDGPFVTMCNPSDMFASVCPQGWAWQSVDYRQFPGKGLWFPRKSPVRKSPWFLGKIPRSPRQSALKKSTQKMVAKNVPGTFVEKDRLEEHHPQKITAQKIIRKLLCMKVLSFPTNDNCIIDLLTL